MTFKTIPPRVININGFFVGSGIRANPWSAIYATLRGTKLQSVRTRTNVDCVGRSGILPVHVQTLGAPLFWPFDDLNKRMLFFPIMLFLFMTNLWRSKMLTVLWPLFKFSTRGMNYRIPLWFLVCLNIVMWFLIIVVIFGNLAGRTCRTVSVTFAPTFARQSQVSYFLAIFDSRSLHWANPYLSSLSSTWSSW